MPLPYAQVGETRRIVSLHADEELKRHLMDLGFVIGERVQIVGTTKEGLILSLKGVRLALNRGLAHQINVA
ncbi:MAG: ferrous iron transport protein A [Spirochaetales bacterium]|jgi:ferrous iron transport protein A|nr:ferrous iron transport protein A [Spirochaetales bacterium]